MGYGGYLDDMSPREQDRHFEEQRQAEKSRSECDNCRYKKFYDIHKDRPV